MAGPEAVSLGIESAPFRPPVIKMVGYSLGGVTVPCKEIREGNQRLAALRGGMLVSLIRIKGAVFNVM
jgi:hypothetical protein